MQQLQAVMRDGAQLASAGWVRLQHRLIVWKLAGYQRRYGSDRMVAGAPLPAQFSTPPSFVDLFSAAAVHRQLTRRYDYEMRQGAKPAVRRLLEGTLSSRAHMVLCVSAVDEARGALELTDGWYCVWASCDEPLQAQLERRRLFVGLKLRVCGCTEPSAIEEERRKKSGDAAASLQAWELCGAPDAPRIELHANGTRRAAWDAKLGLVKGSPTFRVGLNSLQPGGGGPPALHVLVARVLGPLVFEQGEKTRWLTVAQAQAEAEAAHEKAAAKAARRHEAREKARERRARAGDDGDSDDDDDDDDKEEEREPPRRSLVWRLTLVDSGQSSSGVPPPLSLDVCGTTSLWRDFSGDYEGADDDGPLEGSSGWIVNSKLSAKKDGGGSGFVGLAATRAAQARFATTARWPAALGLELDRRSAGFVADRVAGGGGGSAAVRASALAARGLDRVYTPIGDNLSDNPLPPGALFDTVGYLVFVGAPYEMDEAWGAQRESRTLFLLDRSQQLLCIKWIRPPNEPLPKLMPGQPLCALNCRWEGTDRATWEASVPMPERLQYLTQPRYRVVHNASAEALGFAPARISHKCAPSRMAHLREAHEALSAQCDEMSLMLSIFSAIALEISHGRLRSAPPPAMAPPLALPAPFQPLPPQPQQHPVVPWSSSSIQQPPPSAIPAHVQQPQRAATVDSPLSSQNMRLDDSSPRQNAMITAVRNVLEAADASGLLPGDVIERVCAQPPEELADLGGEEVADAAKSAIAALMKAFEIYTGEDSRLKML